MESERQRLTRTLLQRDQASLYESSIIRQSGGLQCEHKYYRMMIMRDDNGDDDDQEEEVPIVS